MHMVRLIERVIERDGSRVETVIGLALIKSGWEEVDGNRISTKSSQACSSSVTQDD